MDPFSQSDQEKRNFCDDWYMTAIAKKYPENEVEWERCTHRLLDDAKVYLDAILQCIITVSASEHFDVVLKEWINLVKRDFGVYDFEVVLKEALINHGLEGIFDTNKIVKLEIDKWRDELKVLKDGFDFHVESYKIVEKFIQRKELCPISGRDLIEIGVPKGEFLGDALKLAKEIFYQDPCKNEILLQRVKKALKYVI